jgi:purine-cytosine permease-like protein
VSAFWTDLLLYFGGLLVGLAAKFWLDVQLRRPSLVQAILLVAIFGVVLFLLNVTGARLDRWVLTLLWPVIGLLVGLGARDERMGL